MQKYNGKEYITLCNFSLLQMHTDLLFAQCNFEILKGE